MTGKVIYQGQRPELATYSASLLLVDGKIYCINEEGTTTVVKGEPAFEILVKNKRESSTLASPVAVGNQIYVRTADYLYARKNASARAAGHIIKEIIRK